MASWGKAAGAFCSGWNQFSTSNCERKCRPAHAYRRLGEAVARMWRATAGDIHGLSTEIAVNQPHSGLFSAQASKIHVVMEIYQPVWGEKKAILRRSCC
jgi:hypothetical protein